jgi:hypothetical protein
MKPSGQEEQEDRRYAAIAIAIAASVLRPCLNHGEVVLSVEDADIRDAYAVGEKMLKAGQLKKFFKSRRQLMDSIRSAVAEHRTKRCSLCEPNRPH